jgi:hypothetical protein
MATKQPEGGNEDDRKYSINKDWHEFILNFTIVPFDTIDYENQ